MLEPTFVAPQLPPAPEEVLLKVEQPELQEAQLQLQPEPVLVLGWQGGLDLGPEDQAGGMQQQQGGSSGAASVEARAQMGQAVASDGAAASRSDAAASVKPKVGSLEPWPSSVVSAIAQQALL